MSLFLSATASAIAPGLLQASFMAAGGTPPYTYAVLAGGAGGSINASTGAYLSPLVIDNDPAKSYDTIQVTDGVAATATLQILVANVMGLFCEIIQHEMGLASDHIYIYNQKIFQPKDSSLYVAVGVLNSKPFGNTNTFDGSSVNSIQSVNMLDTLNVDLISRSNEALFRRAELLLALGSNYAEYQQEANGFFIGRLPPAGQFINLSELDGAAIPYRFRITINVQYFFRKVQAVPYFDDFATPEVQTEP